jgi:hypothetical protein
MHARLEINFPAAALEENANQIQLIVMVNDIMLHCRPIETEANFLKTDRKLTASF